MEQTFEQMKDAAKEVHRRFTSIAIPRSMILLIPTMCEICAVS